MIPLVTNILAPEMIEEKPEWKQQWLENTLIPLLIANISAPEITEGKLAQKQQLVIK